MQISNVVNTIQYTKPVSFQGVKQKSSQPEYIDRAASSRASTGALLGNILGGMLIGAPAARTILQSNLTTQALKASPIGKIILALGVVLLSTVTPAFLAAKYLVNKNRSEETKLSNGSIAKLTAASIAGTALGGFVGNTLQSKMASNGILPMLANAIITVMGNDTAVNMMAKSNNKKSPQGTSSSPIQEMVQLPSSSQQFEYFLLKAQKQ